MIGIDKELLEQLEGWTYKQLNGIDVLLSEDVESSGKIGIEIIRNTKKEVDHINGFIMEGAERIYDTNRFTNIHRTAITVVEGYIFGEQVQTPTEHIIPTIHSIRDTSDIVPTKQFFPEVLTEKQLIEKHPGAISVLVNLQQTDPLYIKERPGRGKMVNYVEGNYMIRALNLAFLFDWSFEVIDVREDTKEMIVLGKLTVHTGDKTIVKTQYGTQEMRYIKGTKDPISIGDTMKSASTDALKKCASQLGIAQDVYSA